MNFIDIGNTTIKIKKWSGNSWQQVYSTATPNAAEAADYIRRNESKAFAISVVDSAREEMNKLMADHGNSDLIDWLTIDQIPAKTLDYENKETLGMDRYMACLGARSMDEKAVIVIDAGTACTIDYMDDRGVYRGGVIMPGISLWEKSLRQFAPALPSVERDIPMKWPGKSTEDSVRWGLTGAFVSAVDGLVRRYDNLASLYVTGGDGDWLARRIERSSKVNSNLIFYGMKKLVESRMWFS
ncbi:MAG: type III pantothenate kinase [Balneolales bacterium]|nr:type III pantothenate kinase [Balneolales bacterium]